MSTPQPLEEGPSKGLGQISLLSHDARLKGRPRLCSDCGLCDSSLKPLMPTACVFVENRTAAIEQRLHGRARRPDDELRFGIHRAQYIARLRRPNPKGQWSGMVTALGARLLDTGRVEAVITTGAAPGTRFKAQPVLARTPEEMLASAGNKPCLSPNLALLDEVRKQGIRRLAVVATSCQAHMLRALEAELGLERLDIIASRAATMSPGTICNIFSRPSRARPRPSSTTSSCRISASGCATRTGTSSG